MRPNPSERGQARDMRAIRAAVACALGHERMVLGVSGGIDSMLLLELAASALARERLVVATFDHGTGPTASAAVAFVSCRAARLGLECLVGRQHTTGLKAAQLSEATLRTERWQFLRRVCRERGASAVVTAHTRDDQAETVLMRVLRGSGARGLAGLYADSPTRRPLIAFTRAQVAACVEKLGIAWVEDPSNVSRRYLRNRIRHDLLPALRLVNPDIEGELLSLATRAADWRRSIEAAASRFIVGAPPDGVDVDAAALRHVAPPGVAVLWAAFAGRAGVVLDRRGVARLVQFSVNARVGSRVQVAGGWEVVRSRDAFQLRPSPASTPAPVALSTAIEVRWGRWLFRPVSTSTPVPVDRTAATGLRDVWSIRLEPGAHASIRAWRPGDALVARAGGGRRKVKRLLSSAGVTGHDRAGWPVVVVGDEVVWVPGIVCAGGSSAAKAGALGARTADFGLAFECEQLSR